MLTFFQKTVATVVKAIFAAVGAGKASEGGETGSEEDGELDHSGEEIESVLVFEEFESRLDGLWRVLVVVDDVERTFYQSSALLFILETP